MTCLWPGLPQLWTCASWPALAVAAAAAAVLDLALLSSFVFPELLATDVRRALWVALTAGWVVSAVWSVAFNRHRSGRGEEDLAGDAFDKAVQYYLEGDWFEAQRTLGRLLRKDPRDADARLMLATLLRHTGQRQEAAEQLTQLERLEDAEKWAVEIRRERELLAAAARQDGQLDEEKSDPKPTDPPAEMMHAA